MKKTPSLLMLLSIMLISLTQSCKYDGNKVVANPSTIIEDTVKKPKEKIYEPKEKVEIYLASIKQKGGDGEISYHLAMFDANGDYAVDSLITMVFPIKGKPEHIKWKKIHDGGIREIKEIKYVGTDEPIIFRKGMINKVDDEWDLEIPINIHELIGDTTRTEKYIIIYVPEDNVEITVEIDPYLRVPPKSPGS